MIEGQEDVTWEDWVALADACERSGVEALFRSDHYVSVMGEGERGSLDAWGTINALAARTTTLRLGHDGLADRASATRRCWPSSSTTADHVSGGRIELGLGTGWSEIEHTAYGFPFLSMKERMDVLEEQLDDHPRRALATAARSASRASTTSSRTSTRGRCRSSARTRR